MAKKALQRGKQGEAEEILTKTEIVRLKDYNFSDLELVLLNSYLQTTELLAEVVQHVMSFKEREAAFRKIDQWLSRFNT